MGILHYLNFQFNRKGRKGFAKSAKVKGEWSFIASLAKPLRPLRLDYMSYWKLNVSPKSQHVLYP